MRLGTRYVYLSIGNSRCSCLCQGMRARRLLGLESVVSGRSARTRAGFQAGGSRLGTRCGRAVPEIWVAIALESLFCFCSHTELCTGVGVHAGFSLDGSFTLLEVSLRACQDRRGGLRSLRITSSPRLKLYHHFIQSPHSPYCSTHLPLPFHSKSHPFRPISLFLYPCSLISAQNPKLITQALVVRGWKSSAGWCFPRGKININEPELECAIREVYEETGFDLTGYIKDPARDRIQTQINAQTVTMFVAMGVWEGTRFGARTKKEIGVSAHDLVWSIEAVAIFARFDG